jgi:Fe2+ transport system protein B
MDIEANCQPLLAPSKQARTEPEELKTFVFDQSRTQARTAKRDETVDAMIALFQLHAMRVLRILMFLLTSLISMSCLITIAVLLRHMAVWDNDMFVWAVDKLFWAYIICLLVAAIYGHGLGMALLWGK